jgi:hypothetical protein
LGILNAIKESIGKAHPFQGRQPAHSPQARPLQPNSQQPLSPNTGPLASGGPHLQENQGSQLNLVNYSPEQLLQHVEQTLSSVHFGMSLSRKIKENISEFWSVAAPIVLCSGTVGEVYFFIASNMAKGKDGLSWWVVWSIIATIMALEVSFMVVSMKSDTIRNDLREKGGGTDLEKKELRHHMIFWFILASGVAIGQISFLVVSLMAGLNNLPFLICFSIGRSVFTLAADFYVGFVHKAKPTTSEQAHMKLESRAKAAEKLLLQKSNEVKILNEGQLNLRQAHAEAQVKDVKITTMLEVEKLQSKAQVDTLRTQQEQATMFTQLSNNMMRALFDPTLPDDQREKLLGTMQGFMSAMKQLPQPRVNRIEEETNTNDL